MACCQPPYPFRQLHAHVLTDLPTLHVPSTDGQQRTSELALIGDLAHHHVPAVLEADAAHVCALVVPHLAGLELGGHLQSPVFVTATPGFHVASKSKY